MTVCVNQLGWTCIACSSPTLLALARKMMSLSAHLRANISTMYFAFCKQADDLFLEKHLPGPIHPKTLLNHLSVCTYVNTWMSFSLMSCLKQQSNNKASKWDKQINKQVGWSKTCKANMDPVGQ